MTRMGVKNGYDFCLIVRDFVTYCYTGSQTYFTPKGKDVIRVKFQKKCAEELLSKMAR